MNNNNKNKNININLRSCMSFILPMLLVILLFTFLNNMQDQKENINISNFIEYMEEDRIEAIQTVGNNLKGKFKANKVPEGRDSDTFSTYIPDEMINTFYDSYLKDRVESKDIEYSSKEDPGPSILEELIPVLIEVGIMVVFFMFIYKSMRGQNQMGDFGKSKAVQYKKNTGITFNDVAGLKEEKEELWEVVDFLKKPRRYTEMGARIPKGVLMVGPPGTGKTYLSMAVAGEAGVPFYSISGSDFVEMFVGVGASRVRDLFDEAKKNAPSIIFIDEIDAVGRQRGTGMGGGHDEREQTLNQLLVEMDGFSKNEGVIVMAATNRADVLDPALLRPGRFDRTVRIGYPDVRERLEILKVHTRNKKLAPDTDLNIVAKATAGFTPADLENITNEAALLAARLNKEYIDNELLYEATIKVVAGPEKKSKVVIEKERVLTAYHEAGHAIVNNSIDDVAPVSLITIVPRGGAGGFTAFIPEEDRQFSTRNEMYNELVTFFGGRAAEELVLDDISTGASNDIERATKLARSMVTTYGFSKKMGPIKYEDSSDDVFLGRTLGKGTSLSNEFANEIDEEVRRIIISAYDKAKEILKRNETLLHKLSEVLLDKETINKKEFDSLYEQYSNNKIEENDENELAKEN